MALYISHSIFHLARLLYVRPETFGPYYVWWGWHVGSFRSGVRRFWDVWESEGILSVELFGRGATVNWELYEYVQILKKFKQIPRVRPNMQMNQVVTLHNNTRLHTAVCARQAVAILGLTVLRHPLYSPYLSPSNFHLFGLLKDAVLRTTTNRNTACVKNCDTSA